MSKRKDVERLVPIFAITNLVTQHEARQMLKRQPARKLRYKVEDIKYAKLMLTDPDFEREIRRIKSRDPVACRMFLLLELNIFPEHLMLQ